MLEHCDDGGQRNGNDRQGPVFESGCPGRKPRLEQEDRNQWNRQHQHQAADAEMFLSYDLVAVHRRGEQEIECLVRAFAADQAGGLDGDQQHPQSPDDVKSFGRDSQTRLVGHAGNGGQDQE